MQPVRPMEPEGSGTLMLHLLGKCNLTCAHCYMDGAPARRERLSLNHVIDAISDCAALGVGNLYLTGGEPLMYRELPAVLEAASGAAGLQTTLCTNATLLTTRNIGCIAASGASLNVSVDGKPQYHDEFRRVPGAFAKTETGVKLAVAAGVPVSLVMTVSQANIAQAPFVADWALEAGVGAIRFQPLLRLGRGASIADQRLADAEIADLVMLVSDLANRHRDRLTCSIIGHSRRFILAHPCAAYVCNGTGCHRRIAREIKKIVVRENGMILPEATNLDPRFAIGRISDGRLTTLVEKFLDGDYRRFDALCRQTYATVLPRWEAAVVPWDQILAEASHSASENPEVDPIADGVCGSNRSEPGRELALH